MMVMFVHPLSRIPRTVHGTRYSPLASTAPRCCPIDARPNPHESRWSYERPRELEQRELRFHINNFRVVADKNRVLFDRFRLGSPSSPPSPAIVARMLPQGRVDELAGAMPVFLFATRILTISQFVVIRSSRASH